MTEPAVNEEELKHTDAISKIIAEEDLALKENIQKKFKNVKNFVLEEHELLDRPEIKASQDLEKMGRAMDFRMEEFQDDGVEDMSMSLNDLEVKIFNAKLDQNYYNDYFSEF